MHRSYILSKECEEYRIECYFIKSKNVERAELPIFEDIVIAFVMLGTGETNKT